MDRPTPVVLPTRSVVVPCYNEAANLPTLIARFAAERGRPDRSDDWELILVDNGSTDDSPAVFARELADPARSFARVITVPPPNIGYGHGIMTGLRAAKGQWLAWTHADGQTPPADVLRAFDLLASAPHPERTLVKGRRRGRPPMDSVFTLGMQVTARVVLGQNLADVYGQPKAFPRALLDRATAPPTDLSLDVYFLWLARTQGFDVRTFDVHFGARAFGESKWAINWRSKARTIARVVRFMTALRTGGTYDRA